MELRSSKDFWPHGQSGARPSDALRPLVWDELCSKLNAFYNLRRAAAGSGADLPAGWVAGRPLTGSFHGVLAQETASNGVAGDINLNSSVNDKAGAGTVDMDENVAHEPARKRK